MPSKQKIGKQRKKERKKQQKADDRRNGIVRNKSAYPASSALEWRRQGFDHSSTICMFIVKESGIPTFGSDPAVTFRAIGMVGLREKGYNITASDVLSYLKRCGKETFDQVISYVGRGITMPSIWIGMLTSIVFHDQSYSSMVKIAEGIEPLVRCMCDDIKCLFFKSNKLWEDSIVEFVDLIRTIIVNCIQLEERKNPILQNTVDALLQHEGLLASILQWGFWDNENRPDLVSKLGDENCAKIAELGRIAMEQLILGEGCRAESHEVCITEYGKKWLRQLGSTPVVSKEYNPCCQVSSVAGLIRLLGSSQYKGSLLCLSYLVKGAADFEWVDKGVINEIIKLGNKISKDSEPTLAHAVASLASIMLFHGIIDTSTTQYTDINGHSSDSRVAVAVRSGLIEMCFNLITCFGCSESFLKTTLYTFHLPSLSISKYIESIFKAVHCSSFDNKTWKAIRHRKDEMSLS